MTILRVVTARLGCLFAAGRRLTFAHILVTAGLLACAEAQAQATPEHQLALLRAAIGGKAWDGIRSIDTEYRIDHAAGTTVIHRIEDVQAGRYLMTVSRPSRTFATGYDGVSVWDQNSGVYYTYGDEDSKRAAENENYRVSRSYLYPARHDAAVAELAPARLGARRFNVLRIAPEGGRPFELWLDARSHLPARIVEQGAERTSITELGDYRRVNGVMMPGSLASDGQQWVATNIVVNGPLKDAIFSMPLGTRPTHAFTGETKVPFRLVKDKIIVPVTVDGHGPLDCEFDTGGDFVLTPEAVKALALTTDGHSRAYGGGEGYVPSSTGTISRLTIGSYQLGPFEYSTLNLGSWRPVLIGEPLLQRAVVRLDFDTMIMTIAPFDSFDYRGSGAIVPFSFQDNQPQVIGSVDGIAARLTIDTGDAGSLLLIAPFAKRYHLVERYHAHIPYEGTAVGKTHGYYVRAGTVLLNDIDGQPVVESRLPVARISDQKEGFDANRYVSANVGIGILKHFNITFDYARRRIIFERNRSYGSPDLFNRTGLVMDQDATGWILRSVYPGSPAEEAGLKPGVTIASFNGRKADELSTDDIRGLMRGPVGSKLIVGYISADRSAHVLTLTLRELL